MPYTSIPVIYLPNLFDVKSEDRELRAFGAVEAAMPFVSPRVVVEPYYNQLILYLRFEKGADLEFMDVRIKYRQPFDDVDYERDATSFGADAMEQKILPFRYRVTGNYALAVPVRDAAFIVECSFTGDFAGTNLGVKATLGIA